MLAHAALDCINKHSHCEIPVIDEAIEGKPYEAISDVLRDYFNEEDYFTDTAIKNIFDIFRPYLKRKPDEDTVTMSRDRYQRDINERNQLREQSNAEMLRVKMCEHIAEGEEGWNTPENRNICPSTMAVAELRDAYERLRRLVNTPELIDFSKAVHVEAIHQRERWGEEHDKAKGQEDWFWLIGYVAGKALSAGKQGDMEKLRHHIITTAAVCNNWHASIKLHRRTEHLKEGETVLIRLDSDHPWSGESGTLISYSPYGLKCLSLKGWLIELRGGHRTYGKPQDLLSESKPKHHESQCSALKVSMKLCKRILCLMQEFSDLVAHLPLRHGN